ncbi:MAG TPA: DUF5010 domain-containing protein [Phycisphaerae bacterium]|nr:DUF5010 domain-containing protein [Phycisphaerae bacterium]
MRPTVRLIAYGLAALTAASAGFAQEAPFTERAVLDCPAPGKHIRFPPDVAVPKGFSARDRIVATYYFYWYDDASGLHFVDHDGTDALTDHPANPKGYSYKRPEWHKQEMQDMMAAGIDVVLPVYWGCPANLMATRGHNRWSYDGLAPLVGAQEALTAEGKTPPRIGMFYDTSTLRHNAGGHHVDLSTAAGRAWFYATIRNFFSLIPPQRWATIDGKPIVFLYSAGFAKSGSDDPRLLKYVHDHFARDFGGARPYIVAEQSWQLPADSTYAWGAAFGLRALGVAAVGPGYDDSAVPGRTTPRQDREGGAFYRRNWELLLAMNPGRRPNLVAVETWNEWHEGTDVAHSREYGRQYIELTRHYADLWRAGKHLKPTGPYADAREVSITFGPNGKSNGLGLKTGGDGLAEVTAAAGAHCIQTLPNPHGEGKYLYFDVDGSFYFDSGGALDVTVEYLDEGTLPFDLQYDSTDPHATLSGAYKSAGAVQRKGTGAWRMATFALRDPRLVNRQNLGSDLRLFTPRGTLKVRRLAVRRAP